VFHKTISDDFQLRQPLSAKAEYFPHDGIMAM
jgi:hypothetical protein